MLRNFGERAADCLAVVRRMETTFKRPARGRIFGRATVGEAARAQLAAELGKKRALSFTVRGDVFDEAGVHSLSGRVEWFITRRGPAADA